MLWVNSDTHHQQKQQINVSEKSAGKKKHTKMCENIPVNVPPSSKSHPQPRSLGFLQHLAIYSVAPFRRCHSSNGCDPLEYNTNVAHPSGAKYLGKKVAKNQNSGRCPNQENNHGNHEILPKTKKNETLSKDPLISLYISIFVTYTKQGLLVFLGGKKAQHPTLNHHHPSNPQPPGIPPCRSSRSHSAPSSHRKATLAPSFWNLAAYSWKRSIFGSVEIFPRSEKTPRKVVDKNTCQGKDGGKFGVVFSQNSDYFFLVKKQDAVVCGWFQKICSNKVLRKKDEETHLWTLT